MTGMKGITTDKTPACRNFGPFPKSVARCPSCFVDPGQVVLITAQSIETTFKEFFIVLKNVQKIFRTDLFAGFKVYVYIGNNVGS